MVAVMLLDKTASFRAAHDKPRMDNPDVRRMRATVQLVPDPQLETRLPRREATVTITLADNTQLTEHVDAVRGTAENPMPRAEVVTKCRDLMAPILGLTTCNSLIDRVLTLEKLDDVRSLRPLLQRA
jgi:2-methylcitrate dehydratase PrpD